MIPTQGPAAAWAAPVPVEGEIEQRASEPAEAVGPAHGGGHLPAGRGGARQRIRLMAQQQAETAARLRGEREPARRREIGGGAVLRQLRQSDRQGRAFERFL